MDELPLGCDLYGEYSLIALHAHFFVQSSVQNGAYSVLFYDRTPVETAAVGIAFCQADDVTP